MWALARAGASANRPPRDKYSYHSVASQGPGSRRRGPREGDFVGHNTDILIADADVTFVIVDTKTGKSVPLEGEFLELMKSF